MKNSANQMTTVPTVLLSAKGDTRKANILIENDGSTNLVHIQKYFRKKETPEIIGFYESDSKYFTLFGYKKGKTGTENKTELPAPYHTLPLFGDIIVLASLTKDWTRPLPFTTEQWADFYDNYSARMDGTNQAEVNGNDEDDSSTDTDSDEEMEDSGDGEDAKEDDFENDDESEGCADVADSGDEDDIEPEPIIYKRRKQPMYTTKGDANILKDNIDLDSSSQDTPIRRACLKQLAFLRDIQHIGNEPDERVEKAILKVAYEYAKKYYVICNWNCPQFQEIYKNTTRSVLSNIHPQSPLQNVRLMHRALAGEFPIDSIPQMTSYEMYPEHWKGLADKQLIREQKLLEGDKSRATDQYKCHRCGKRECSYYELQTRSADEPMTIFITCLNCGKRWRQ